MTLDPIELCFGMPLGASRRTAVVGAGPRYESARDALEADLRAALETGSCVVAFSGGRDSSLLLALAADVARREGLPLPVPATHVFPEIADSREDDWQELVVRHLDLPDWQRLSWTDELDVLGPIALQQVRIGGPLAPVNLHMLVPLAELAGAGGALVTGTGGDELFDLGDRRLAARWVYGGLRPGKRQLPRALLQAAPTAVRRVSTQVTERMSYGWLTARGRRSLRRRFATWTAAQPLDYRFALLDWWATSRTVLLPHARMDQMVAATGATPHHPLAGPDFLDAFARECPREGPRGRRSVYTSWAGTLLPETLLARRTKAGFGEAFLGRSTREFIGCWSGSGLDETLVEPTRLREHWKGAWIDPHSATLLQVAWLSEQR